jgi:aspartate aminotransferase
MSGIISNVVSNTRVSPAFLINEEARQLMQDGYDVVFFCLGEPDFEIPEHIRDAAISAAKIGFNRYPSLQGLQILKQAVVNKMKRDQNLNFTEKQVVITNGVKQALFNVIAATCNPKDEIIIPAPYWMSYNEISTFLNLNSVICTPNSQMMIDPELLDDVITPKTKWLIINSPNNPSGTVYSGENLRKIADVLLMPKNQHVMILSDDIYEYIIVNDQKKFYNIVQIEPKLLNRTVIVNGVSKAYSMMGWRVGYLVSNNEEIINATVKVQATVTSGVCTIAQHAAAAAINGPQDCILEFKRSFQNRLRLALSILRDITNIDYNVPDGAFYVLVDCRKMIGKKFRGYEIKETMDFCVQFLKNYYVALTPCDEFGAEGYIRISYATNEDNITKGLNRLKEFCEEIS